MFSISFSNRSGSFEMYEFDSRGRIHKFLRKKTFLERKIVYYATGG